MTQACHVPQIYQNVVRGSGGIGLTRPKYIPKLSGNSPSLGIKVPPIKTLAKLKEKESRLRLPSASPDIASWISSSVETGMLDDMSEGSDPGFVWRRDIARGEWADVIEYASRQLLMSRTSVRVPFLQEDLLPFVKNEGTSLSR
jgi:hypothetical protein